MSVVFKDGTVIDGTGAPPTSGDVLTSGQIIERVGVFEAPADAQVLEISDLHGHIDAGVLRHTQDHAVGLILAESGN